MSNPTVISLFTGAGGLDLGLEAAGFDTRVAVEFDADACKTLRHNREWPVIERDIHEVKTAEILKTADLQVGDADLLVGGPPCQPFSKSGYWARGDARRLDDPRASTLEAYLRVLKEAQPKVFLLENVAGLAYQRKAEGLELLERTVASINADVGTDYSFSYQVLNAADFGAPQERERLFVVGARDGGLFEFPKETHGPTSDGRSGAKLLEMIRPEPRRTAWDAIGDLENDDDPTLRMTGKWAGLLPSIPEGHNYLHHTDRGAGLPLFGWRRRYWSFLLKLAKSMPSWTITAQPGSAIGPFHWKNRRLSMRELCRLQTFPDDIHVVGSRSTYQRQIGNAVPSVLAEAIGRQIATVTLGRSLRSAATLSPPVRGKILMPEPTEPVPDRYLRLVGNHAPHPGTGEGYGALARAEGR